jgi:hypothetical protein
MPTLSNPKLAIQLASGTNQRKVTATVTVSFNAVEENMIKVLGLAPRLACRVYGEDGGIFTGDDDLLFSYTTKTVTKDGTYIFSGTVNKAVLDEDTVGNDEIVAKFGLTTPSFPMSAAAKSPTISGDF